MSTHAEIDALNRLKYSRITRSRYWDKKKLKMDLLVVSFNPSGSLRMSKPCENCMKKLAEDKCVKIRYVYYSDRGGKIIKRKFNDIWDDYFNKKN